MNARLEPRPQRRLGDILIEKGIMTPDQLSIALLEQKKSGKQLGKIVVELGFATEAVVRDALSESLGQESIDLSHVVIDRETLSLLPKEAARRYRALPIALDEEKGELVIAMADPTNLVAIDQLRALVGTDYEIRPLLASESDIENAINQFYGYNLSIDAILHELETGEIDYASLDAASDEYSQPLVRLVDALLADAVKQGASDIHFEPEAGFLRIRYRIDGVLHQVRSLHKHYWSGIAVRLKVMAGMNIAETRSPQDGRISLTLFHRQVDFRVSTQPTTWGENIVLRILDRNKGIVPLERLGLTEEALAMLKLMMARPEGILLVTGPTGSGKTTTLYSMLNHINSESINIMTLEDPVEYPMQLIRQTNVGESARIDFASGIRSLLRQDPDVILVGEIRDEDTADMALRAAMTGHQVYSTLHTNSAVGAITRLLDLGIVPDVLAGNIIGIVAQRLVRRLCTRCREAYVPDEVEQRLLGLQAPQEVWRARGCPACNHTGYRGRTAVMELLRMNADLDELVARRATRKEILDTALQHGFVPIAQDAVRRVLDGTTSLEEISRVVDLTDRLVH
ncbi:MAG: type II/IV secretion system protein [Gammaproteobacteria bacterium]|nr:MAG: type II/IV secretion system protein [Gammaproteobacteria bacterium]